MSDGRDVRDPGMEGRKRLIDHFKRVYNIVAGLAITEAVRRLFPIDAKFLQGPAPWLFATFIATIVPIFHGGDRSLDAKYWDKPRTEGWGRAWFLVDVWALLITAMAFVAIAESIPKPGDCGAAKTCTTTDGKWFALLLGATIAFDVVVLAAEYLREKRGASAAAPARAAGRDFVEAYPTWIALNIPFAAVCVFTACMAWDLWGIADALPATVLDWTLPFLTFAALLRTWLDYRRSGDFLFP